MGARFWHRSTAGRDVTATAPRPGEDDIDWPAVQRADRACCCPARPAVIAILPPSAGRPHQTELLLCGHHYQVGQRALHAAGAALLDITGTPIAEGTRPPARAGV